MWITDGNWYLICSTVLSETCLLLYPHSSCTHPTEQLQNQWDMGETADGDLHNKVWVSTYTSQKLSLISHNHCISWIPPREEPFLNLVHSCTKDLAMEQVNCKERNLIPVKCKPPSYWVSYSQRSSDPGWVFISLQDPENLPLSGDGLCCLASSRKRKRR